MITEGRQRIRNLKNPHYLYGIVQSNDFKNNLNYFTGFEVTGNEAWNGLRKLSIAANKYAVFKYIGKISPLDLSPKYTRETYKYVLDIWLPNSGYKLKDNYLIEFFDEEVLKEDYLEMDIMLPIK